jgi:predicted nuclease of predicted toxin-antitoxin system
MKICVDENIPLVTVSELSNLGHNVLDIRGTANQGIPDDLLWALVQNERRMLITTDKGFVQCRGESHYGILVVRLRQPNEQKIHERVMHAISQFSGEWVGLVVVMRDMVQSVWRAT